LKIFKTAFFYFQGEKGEGKEKLPQVGLIDEESPWRNMVNINMWKLVCVYRVVFGSCLLATDNLTGFVTAGTVYRTKDLVTICLKRAARDIEASSCNHRCCGEAVSVSYSECVINPYAKYIK